MSTPPSTARREPRAHSFFHRAAFFWRGGAVVAGAVFAGFLVLAYTLAEVYQSDAVVELVLPAGAPPDGLPSNVVLAERLRGALMDPPRLEALGRLLSPDLAPREAVPEDVIERARQAVDVKAQAEHEFELAFRAGNAESAQRGCGELAQAALAQLRGARAVNDAERESTNRAKALEDKLRQLAALIAAHPEIALGTETPSGAPSGASSARPAAPPQDSALVLLQQQKARLEARVLELESRDAGPARAEPNPYDPPEDEAEGAGPQRMLAQVKAAIAARQAATVRAQAAPQTSGPGVKRTPAPAPAPTTEALQAEWQRLVQAVAEAQQPSSAVPTPAPDALSARMVRGPSLPTEPRKPNRPLIALVGLTAALWLGVLWAFARVALGHDRRRLRARAHAAHDGAGAHGGLAGAGFSSDHGEAARRASSGRFAAERRVDSSAPGSASLPPAPGPARAAFWSSPMKLRISQPPPGVIDVARAVAEHEREEEERSEIDARPIVEVGTPHGPGDRARPTSAAAFAGSPRPAHEASRPASDPPHTGSDPPRFGSEAPRTGSDPPRFGSEAPRQPSGSHPDIPPGDRPPFARAWRPAGSARSVPPPDPGVAPEPIQAEPAPQRASWGLATRRRSAEESFAVRDVPSGWSPDPSLADTRSLDDLRDLRDQIHRFASGKCFVVGVSSAPDAAAGKSKIAAQLALLLAEPRRARILFVEANFDRPAVHVTMRVDMPLSSGFSQQVRRRMTGSAIAPWVIVRAMSNLHVLAEGIVRSPGILSSAQFGDAILELREYYDVILIDGPIAGDGVDTRALDAVSDGLLLINRKSRGAEPSNEVAEWFSKKQFLAVASID